MKNFILRTITAIGIVAVQVLCTYYSPLSLAAVSLIQMKTKMLRGMA